MQIRAKIIRIPSNGEGEKRIKFEEGATLRGVLNGMPAPYNDYGSYAFEIHRDTDYITVNDLSSFTLRDGDEIVMSAKVKGNDDMGKLIDAFASLADGVAPMVNRDIDWLLANYNPDKPAIINELTDRCNQPFIVFSDAAQQQVDVGTTLRIYQEMKRGGQPINVANPYIQLDGKWFRVYRAGEAMKEFGEICPITGVYLISGFSSGINRNWNGIDARVRELVFVYRVAKYGTCLPQGVELELLVQKVFANPTYEAVASVLPEGALELERLAKAGVNVAQRLIRAYPEGATQFDALITAPATKVTAGYEKAVKVEGNPFRYYGQRMTGLNEVSVEIED